MSRPVLTKEILAMNTSLKIVIPIFLFALTSCTAQMIVPPGNTKSKYAPANQSSNKGIVKYSTEGARSVVEARREDAYKRMYSACGGRYIIVSEGMKPEGAYSMPVNTGSESPMYVSGTMNAVYIVFECLE
jgi:hypothetical protein